MNSWRPTTQKAYDTYIKRWQMYVEKKKIEKATHIHVLNFLADLYATGASHSTVNLARSAVSAYLQKSGTEAIGSHPLVCRLVKGVFEKRPSMPKYQETWDVDKVLEILETWPEVEELSLKKLTLRLIMLLALVSGQRGQTIHTLKVDDIRLKEERCTLVFSAVLKQTRAGTHLKPLELKTFENKRLCIVTHLRHYLKVTETLRKGKQLFISFMKPHNEVSRDTISRWIKTVLELAGVDISQFAAHSTRSASTSAAFNRDVPIDCIMNAAGWTQQSTFAKFYCKPVTVKSLGQSVLDKFVNKK